MLGLGEEKAELAQVMDDFRIADIDFITMGQYLQPTVKHAAVARFVTPDEFADYAAMARVKGFLQVSATPLTRSSYHADADFAALREAREAQLRNRGSIKNKPKIKLNFKNQLLQHRVGTFKKTVFLNCLHQVENMLPKCFF